MIDDQLNLSIATIAGWGDIHEWNPNPKEEKSVKTWQGTNEAHPELGTFIPDYVNSIDSISLVFEMLSIKWQLTNLQDYSTASLIDFEDGHGAIGSSLEVSDVSPALALCKLLLLINPKPIRKAIIVEATFC